MVESETSDLVKNCIDLGKRMDNFSEDDTKNELVREKIIELDREYNCLMDEALKYEDTDAINLLEFYNNSIRVRLISRLKGSQYKEIGNEDYSDLGNNV